MNEITKVLLIIEESKTEIRFFNKKFKILECLDEHGKLSKLQYLGINFDGTNYSLRHKGFANFQRRMTNAVNSAVNKAHVDKRNVSRRKIYEKFTGLGDMNYVSYVKIAGKTLQEPKIIESVKTNKLIRKIKKKIEIFKKQINNP